MKIAFITNVPNSIGRIRLKEEAEARGHEFTIMSWQHIVIDENTISKVTEKLFEFNVVHFAGGLGKFITQATQIALEARGVYCPNSYVRRSLDVDNKVYQAVKLTAAGLPIPKTIRATNPDLNLLDTELGWPMIFKSPHSTQGKGVGLAKTSLDIESLTPKKEYIFQEYIDYDADYRVHVVGGKAFCPYRRTPAKGEFRANVSLGGGLEKIDDAPTVETISKMAISAAKAMNLEFCGVDIIKDKNGNFYILETNSDPGFKSVEEITGESFACPILDYYEQRLAEFKST